MAKQGKNDRLPADIIHEDISLVRFVIPGSTWNPLFSIWISAFAGMTALRLL